MQHLLCFGLPARTLPLVPADSHCVAVAMHSFPQINPRVTAAVGGRARAYCPLGDPVNLLCGMFAAGPDWSCSLGDEFGRDVWSVDCFDCAGDAIEVGCEVDGQVLTADAVARNLGSTFQRHAPVVTARHCMCICSGVLRAHPAAQPPRWSQPDREAACTVSFILSPAPPVSPVWRAGTRRVRLDMQYGQ